MKHIESILPENVADELARLLSDDATISSVLKELLHRDTGCDIPSLDNVPTSDIEEIIPLCLSILRRFWNTPLTALGDGTEKQSFADIFRKAIGSRVQENAMYCIPAISGSVLEVVELLNNRRVDSANIPDGMSLANLFCSGYADSMTELTDNNKGWTMNVNVPSSSLTKLRLGCAYVLNFPANTYLPTTLTEIEFPELISWGVTSEYRVLFIYNNHNITELTFPKCKAIGVGFSYDDPNFGSFISTCSNLKKVSFPELVKFGQGLDSSLFESAYGSLFHSCENLEEVYMPKWTGTNNWRIVRNVPNLRKLVLGVISSGVPALYGLTDYPFDSCINLVHLEIQGCVVSLDLRSWNPTNVLADTELTEQFLSNFQTYIADRVADMTGLPALTLTLSSAVYAALEAQEGQTILATLTNKNWTVAKA